MAEFRPFDLGQVIQTAEAIKGIRRQSVTDSLREQYMGEQIQGMRADRERQTRMDEVTLGKEKAKQVYTTMQYASQSENPKNFLESQVPELVKNLQSNGVQWESVDDAGALQMIKGIMAKAGAEAGIAAPAPISSQGKLVADQRAGFLTADQVTAANAPKNPPSYDEFLKAQKDPAFAAFLKSRKGKGFSVTLPDGTSIEMGGEGGGVGPEELSKPTVNNLQETIVNSTNRLDRLNATLSTYNPDYLRAAGILDANKVKIKDFLGMNVSPQQREYLQKYTDFQTSAGQDLAATLKEMSGAAVTPQEYARTEKTLPSGTELSPAQFEAKARTTMKTITRAIMRANWALKNGIGVQSIEELAKRMPLEGIDGVYESRANQIWQEMGGTPESKAQAIQQANEEFGLAR